MAKAGMLVFGAPGSKIGGSKPAYVSKELEGGMVELVESTLASSTSISIARAVVSHRTLSVLGPPPELGSIVKVVSRDGEIFVVSSTPDGNGLVEITQTTSTWSGLSGSSSSSRTQAPVGDLALVSPPLKPGDRVTASLPDLSGGGDVKEQDVKVDEVNGIGRIRVTVPGTTQQVAIGVCNLPSIEKAAKSAKIPTRDDAATSEGSEGGAGSAGGGGRGGGGGGEESGGGSGDVWPKGMPPPSSDPICPLRGDVVNARTLVSHAEHGVSTPSTLARQASAEPSGSTTVKAEEDRGDRELQAILDECARTGKLYVDKAFPPTEESLGPEKTKISFSGGGSSRVCFKRPHEIVDSDGAWAAADASSPLRWSVVQGDPPVFDPADVAQRALGDCWLVAAVASTAHRYGSIASTFRIQKLSPAGVYQQRINVGGVWFIVTIDDSLPCSEEGFLIFTRGAKRQLWPALLEKTIAAISGSYQSVEAGRAEEGLRLLTGLPVVHMDPSTGRTLEEKRFAKALQKMPKFVETKLVRKEKRTTTGHHTQVTISFEEEPRPSETLPQVLPHYALPSEPRFWGEKPVESKEEMLDRIWERLVEWNRAGHIITLSSASNGNEVGLAEDHGYSLMEVVESVTGTRLLRARNPWGKGTFKGPYGPEWPGWRDPANREDLELLHPGVPASVYEAAGLDRLAAEARERAASDHLASPPTLRRIASSDIGAWAHGAFLIPLEYFVKYFDGATIALQRGNIARRTLALPTSMEAKTWHGFFLLREDEEALIDITLAQPHERERKWFSKTLPSRCDDVVVARDEILGEGGGGEGSGGGGGSAVKLELADEECDVGMSLLRVPEDIKTSTDFLFTADLRRGHHPTNTLEGLALRKPSDSSFEPSGTADGFQPSPLPDVTKLTHDLIVPFGFAHIAPTHHHSTAGKDHVVTIEVGSSIPILLKRVSLPVEFVSRMLLERVRRLGTVEESMPGMGPDGSIGVYSYHLIGDAMEMVAVQNNMTDASFTTSFTPSPGCTGVVPSRGTGKTLDIIPPRTCMITLIVSQETRTGAFSWGGGRSSNLVRPKDGVFANEHDPPIPERGIHMLHSLDDVGERPLPPSKSDTA